MILCVNVYFSVNVFPCTWAKLAYRSVTRVGSCTAWNMASSPTARCPARKPSETATIHSTPSSMKPAPANMCPGLYLSIWSPL